MRVARNYGRERKVKKRQRSARGGEGRGESPWKEKFRGVNSREVGEGEDNIERREE